ncbi:folate carrier protein [Culex quinquefasciatus]|nr:folate carrier protein [Culex quinquefasciatus]|eukprot:XP_001868347.1 folate carrier protein [Culex quinquefasciatus]
MVTFVTYENVSRYLLDLGKAGAPAPSSSSSASSK